MKPTWPSAKAKKQWAVLEALLRGDVLDPLNCMERCGLLAISQECGRLRRMGWPIETLIIRHPNSHHSIYWLPESIRNEYRRAA